MKQRIIAAALFALFAFVSQAQASKLYISEYNGIGITVGLVAQIAPEPGTDQVVDFSGGVASSAAFGANTSYVRVLCDVSCSIKFGASPQTATTSNKLLGAGAAEYFGVKNGHIVSVISNP